MKSVSLCDEHPLAQDIVAQEVAMWAEYDIEQVTGHERVVPNAVDDDDYMWWGE